MVRTPWFTNLAMHHSTVHEEAFKSLALGSNIRVRTPLFTNSRQPRIPHPPRGTQGACAHLKHHSKDPSCSPSLSLSPSSSEVVVHCREKPRRHSLFTNQMPRHVAALTESQSLPPFTRAWLSLITLTLRALGNSLTASTPCEGIATLCFS